MMRPVRRLFDLLLCALCLWGAWYHTPPGAIARTATNIRSGAKSPVAGMVHALTLLFILLVAAPLARVEQERHGEVGARAELMRLDEPLDVLHPPGPVTLRIVRFQPYLYAKP